uniref:Ig-like domain-containing protein n=1 Tax=Erpetoichthys calabaricus TaxID=27687 RepID=A0A8C4THV9_ERPCA
IAFISPSAVLIPFSFVFSAGSSAQITVTQPQTVVTGQSGETVTIKCQTSSSVYNSGYKVDMLDWVLLRSGAPPRGIIYDGVHQVSGAPNRFSGSGGGTKFTLTISGVQPEDAGYYYCAQRYTKPHKGSGQRLFYKPTCRS